MSGSPEGFLDLPPHERVLTAWAIEVVTARLVHDSQCRAARYPYERADCECDLTGTAGAILSALATYVVPPDPGSSPSRPAAPANPA